MENVLEYWWVAALLAAPLLALAGKYAIDAHTNRAIAAVYRASLKEAERLQRYGIAWLTGARGVAFRKALAVKAYAGLPKWVRAVVSEAQWSVAVEAAFNEMVDLANTLSTKR